MSPDKSYSFDRCQKYNFFIISLLFFLTAVKSKGLQIYIDRDFHLFG